MTKIIQRLVGLGVDLSTKKALKRALGIIGVKPDNIDNLYIDLKNSIYDEKFKKTPKERRIVFLPQCLRDCNKCKATLSKFGYKCVKCSSKCKARKIKERAEKLGYKAFIVPGGSMLSKIIKKYRPMAILGVACKKEIVMAFDELNMPTQGVELIKDGCVNTDVDIDEVFKTLKLETSKK
jgi:hypothetical protein